MRTSRDWRMGGRAVTLALGSVVLVGVLAQVSGVAGQAVAAAKANTRTASQSHCPWVSQSLHHLASPTTLANVVHAKMTLAEKVAFVVLRARHGIENTNAGIPSLCIPPLVLSDGPNGIAYGLKGVTQLPAAISVAASFDTAVARAVG